MRASRTVGATPVRVHASDWSVFSQTAMLTKACEFQYLCATCHTQTWMLDEACRNSENQSPFVREDLNRVRLFIAAFRAQQDRDGNHLPQSFEVDEVHKPAIFQRAMLGLQPALAKHRTHMDGKYRPAICLALQGAGPDLQRHRASQHPLGTIRFAAAGTSFMQRVCTDECLAGDSDHLV